MLHSILCLGRLESRNNILITVACGLCSVVLDFTNLNKPNFHNGVYWYYTRFLNLVRSIGFSLSSNINKYPSDVDEDLSSNKRLSWNLGPLNIGGCRIGSLINLHKNVRYYKVILIKI